MLNFEFFSGVQYEMYKGRTLAAVGEHAVYGFGFSPKNAATHSFTVQMTVSMSGNRFVNFERNSIQDCFQAIVCFVQVGLSTPLYA